MAWGFVFDFSFQFGRNEPDESSKGGFFDLDLDADLMTPSGDKELITAEIGGSADVGYSDGGFELFADFMKDITSDFFGMMDPT